MKKIIDKFGGIVPMFYAVAFIAAAVLTAIGLYCIDNVWYYEEPCAIVWAAGSMAIVGTIRKFGEGMIIQESQKKMIEKMDDM